MRALRARGTAYRGTAVRGGYNKLSRSHCFRQRVVRQSIVSRQNIRNYSVRVRFAPSPTGSLHLGGLRTALFNYLFAKQNKGQFILRIEDTDRTRFVEGAEEELVESLEWAGLDIDEGPNNGGESGPYRQSERKELHQKWVNHLVDKGDAYHCFCTPERLDEMRKVQKTRGIMPIYDRYCLRLDPKEKQKLLDDKVPHTIRLKMPDGETTFNDMCCGKVHWKNAFVDDTVLLKSDGNPTYHLANVIDDHFMKITHVIRGSEWVSSIPKHVALYEAFGWDVPKMLHLPLLHSIEGTKLSKRHGDMSVRAFRQKGTISDALVNFVALLGWNPGSHDYQEIFVIDKLIEKFSLETINKSPAIVDSKKFGWFGNVHLKRLIAENPQKVIEEAAPFYKKFNWDPMPSNEFLLKVFDIIKDTKSNYAELCEGSKILVKPPECHEVKEDLFPKINDNMRLFLNDLYKHLTNINDWEKDILNKKIDDLIKEYGLKKKNAFVVVRFGVISVKQGPSVSVLMDLYGKEVTLKRLKHFLEYTSRTKEE